MCIIEGCADPIQPGVWWREDGNWCLYGAGHQQQIRTALSAGLHSIDLGTIPSAVHPRGARYSVNLDAMEQTALSSGFIRPILVIDPVAPPAVQQPSRLLTLQSAVSSQGRAPIHLHYRDSCGNLVQYAGSVAQALWNAVSQGFRHCFVPKDSSSTSYYFFDLKGMVQLVATRANGQYVFSKENPVSFVVDVAWRPDEMAALAVSGEKGWRRKVLEMVVKRYDSDNDLENVLREKARPKVIVRTKRISLRPGEQTYEKFLDSLDNTFTRCDPKLLGVVLKNVKDGRLGSDDGLLQIAVKRESSAQGNNSFPKQTDSLVLLNSMMSVLAAEMTCGMKIAVFLTVMSNSISKAYHSSSLGEYSRLNDHKLLEVKPEHCLRLADITVA